MRKVITLILFLLMLMGCSQKMTEEALIEGNWIATSGYEDGEEKGDPNCYPFEEGIQFKDEDSVFVETFDRDFEYIFSKKDSTITFFNNSRIYSYDIKKISEDKIVFIGLSSYEGRSCVLERTQD